MQGHYHAVVWIDHKQARVFHFDAEAFDTALIAAPIIPATSIMSPITTGPATRPRTRTISSPSPRR